MTHFFAAYVRTLLMIFTLLLFSAFAHVGLGVAMRCYVAVVAPRAAGREKSGSWGGVVFFLLLASVSFWSVGWTVFSVFVLYFPRILGGHTSVWLAGFLSFVSVFYAGIRIYGMRSSYRAFSRVAPFRLWLREVPRAGLGAAHEYFLAGWRSKAVGSASGLAVASGFGLFVLLLLAESLDGGPLRADRAIAEVGVLLAASTCWLVHAGLVRLWFFLRPDCRLAELCVEPLPESGDQPGFFFLGEPAYCIQRPGRWRGRRHQISFEIANLLEVNVRRAKGRFAQFHYVQLELAARRLAQSLRLNGVKMEEEGISAADEEQKVLCLLLATGRDPLAVVPRIARLTDGQPTPPVLPQGRAVKVTEAISAAINRHWSAVKAVAVLLALTWLVVSGKYADAIGLLK